LSGGRAARGDSNRFPFQNSHAAYLQDTYRWGSQLTFNIGLRWDNFGVIEEKNNLLSNFDPVGGLVQVGSPGLPRPYDRDWNNFSPRLSFAWSLDGDSKTVVRAGWGLFYDAFSGLFRRATAVQYFQSRTGIQSGWTNAGALFDRTLDNL